MEPIWHYVVPVFSAVTISIVGWGFRNTMGRLTDKMAVIQKELAEHRIECDKINKAVLDKRVQIMETEIVGVRRFNHWVCETLFRIGGKFGVDLPDRPELPL